ncbi:hypothetical protein [Paraburkholderia ginsengisoli]|uniref:Uncharacterized protein n=1 Tax=Paraburkholderia ginsengisoli TaxID=311231 RepID=A0A7T4T9N1_9BURK|nr:hypothetical protein [Paraburkholderia ginsengisoli]QQC64683.1 hypothetical protein I6I06_04165 [Paraburkholderia ginsengisoli]
MAGAAAIATGRAPRGKGESARLTVPATALVAALATLRGKNTATKIENNSKIFFALSIAKEINLKID